MPSYTEPRPPRPLYEQVMLLQKHYEELKEENDRLRQIIDEQKKEIDALKLVIKSMKD